MAEMWYVACGMLYPTEEQLFCLLISITDESLGFTCASFTHGFLSLYSLLSFSRVTFNPPLHLTLTTLLAISLAKLRFFLGIELKAL